LVRYAVSVMRGWLHSGHVLRLAKLRGYDPHPSEPELTSLATVSDARDELAMMTVAVALPGFRQNALIKGGWKANLGASSTTYFMGPVCSCSRTSSARSGSSGDGGTSPTRHLPGTVMST